MSLIYKKGKEEATLGDMIKMFPDQWNAAVEHDIPFWLNNHITAVDLIVEITDLFDEGIISYQYEQMTSGKWLKMSEEEFEDFSEAHPAWHYEDGSIDENDIIAVLKTGVISW